MGVQSLLRRDGGILKIGEAHYDKIGGVGKRYGENILEFPGKTDQQVTVLL